MNRCWMSLALKHPHVLGAGIGCLMCDAKRREEAQQHESAVAMGLQRPAIARGRGERVKRILLWVGSSARDGQLLPTMHAPAELPERLSFRVGRVRYWRPLDGVAVVIRVTRVPA